MTDMLPPYRTKIVEPLPLPDERSRLRALRRAGYNPFHIPADQVCIDMISDSGTGAMSARQWQALTGASEDFSGQTAYREFIKAARRLFGMRYIQPVHQGRVAENLLFRLFLKTGDMVASNTHFETTRSNIESAGGRAIDLADLRPPYCGNMNIKKLTALLQSTPVRMIVLTITNNIRGGQPVSTDNMQQVKRLCRQYRVPLVYDASRFPDNALLIKEISRTRTPIPDICARMFRFADIIYLSCKKSMLTNVGGCIAMRGKALFENLTIAVLQQESYPTSGGLAARDLAAMTEGIREAIDETWLRAHRIALLHLGTCLRKAGVPVLRPFGGHAVVIPVPRKMPHAAFSLAAAVYLGSGVRGGVFNGQYRLALPRRVYTFEHLEHVAQAVGRAYKKPLMHLQALTEPKAFHDFMIRFRKP